MLDEQSPCIAHAERLASLEASYNSLVKTLDSTEEHICSVISELRNVLVERIKALEDSINGEGGFLRRVTDLELDKSVQDGKVSARTELWQSKLVPFLPWIGVALFGASMYYFGKGVK